MKKHLLIGGVIVVLVIVGILALVSNDYAEAEVNALAFKVNDHYKVLVLLKPKGEGEWHQVPCDYSSKEMPSEEELLRIIKSYL